MIAAQTTHVLDSTIEGDTYAMSIDQDSMVKLMKMYTDLYADRLLACIREISTNALDVHADAGNPDPIEVSLPTPLDPYLRIQDYGTGLTDVEFREVYSKFGKSTRGESNAFAGMFGLGCKAPLTYTSQYTISSVKKGIRYSILITRNELGIGEITVMDRQPTDERDGLLVEIMVSRNDVQACRDRADKFYRFWKPGTVLVDGEQPKPIEGTKVGDDLLIVRGEGRSYVVMGNVPYPVPNDGEAGLNHGLNSGYSLVAYVPMGAVSIPPPREALSDDPHTQKALRVIEDKFKSRIVASIQRDINRCQSPYHAVASLVRWKDILPKSASPDFADYRFQGRTIPVKIELPKDSWIVPHSPPTRRGSGGMTNCEEETAIQAQHLDKRIIFTGWKFTKFSATMRKKLDQWVADNDLKDGGFSYILVPTDKFSSPWFDDALVFPWDDVKATKLKRQEPSASNGWREHRIPGSFDVITVNGWDTGFPADEIDTDEPIFYSVGNIGKAQNYSIAVEKIHTSATLVAVPSNRLNKFKRDFPTAKPVRDVIDTAARLWRSSLDAETVCAMYFQREHRATIDKIRRLAVYRLHDPAFREYAELGGRDVSRDLSAYNKFYDVASYGILTGLFEGIEVPQNPLLKYPLYGETRYSKLSVSNYEHFYLYANAVYAAECATDALDNPVYSD